MKTEYYAILNLEKTAIVGGHEDIDSALADAKANGYDLAKGYSVRIVTDPDIAERVEELGGDDWNTVMLVRDCKEVEA